MKKITFSLYIEGTDRHMHSYTDLPLPGNWEWCETCQCLVTSKCDHRQFPCKGRAEAVQEQENHEQESKDLK